MNREFENKEPTARKGLEDFENKEGNRSKETREPSKGRKPAMGSEPSGRKKGREPRAGSPRMAKARKAQKTGSPRKPCSP